MLSNTGSTKRQVVPRPDHRLSGPLHTSPLERSVASGQLTVHRVFRHQRSCEYFRRSCVRNTEVLVGSDECMIQFPSIIDSFLTRHSVKTSAVSMYRRLPPSSHGPWSSRIADSTPQALAPFSSSTYLQSSFPRNTTSPAKSATTPMN